MAEEGNEEGKSEGKSDKDILEEAKERLKDAIDREAPERIKQLEDLKFVTLDQWDESIRNMRENDVNGPRPCLTIDKISQYRMQIINEIRKNRPAIKIRPVDDESDPKTAEVFQGIIRHNEDISNAALAYETASEWAIDTGAGYFRLVTDYVDEKSLRQEIRTLPIFDGFSVYLGPHLQPDGSDAEYGFILEDLTENKFKRQWPKAKIIPEDLGSDSPFWIGKENVRIAEYFYFDYASTKIFHTADGTPEGKVVLEKDYDGQAEIVEERETSIRSVKWCKLTDQEILEKRDWAGKYIPIVRVTGHQKLVEGKKRVWGIVRPAIDSARMYNYWASTITEKLALSPKIPYIAAEGQLEGREQEWKEANSVNRAVLQYKAIDVNGNAVPPPRRVEPAQLETAMIQQLRIIEHDIQTSLGMFKASVGEEQGDQSGRAIRALQGQSDTATFHFPDNLAKSIRYAGIIQLDLIPKVMDVVTVVRILGEDGKPQQVTMDPGQPQAMRQIQNEDGSVKNIYNLGVGTYDVTVTVGPSYATKRMEAVDVMQDAMKSAPQLLPVIGDLMFRAMDTPYADQIAERLKPKGPQVPPELQAQMQQFQEAVKKLQEENTQLKAGVQADIVKIQEQAKLADAKALADHQENMRKIELDKAVEIEKAKLARWVAEQKAQLERDIAVERDRIEKHKLALETDSKINEQNRTDASTAMPQFLKALDGHTQTLAAITNGIGEIAKGHQQLSQEVSKAMRAERVSEVKMSDGRVLKAISRVH